MVTDMHDGSALAARCHAEIAAIEAELLAGNRDVDGLVLALSDWSAELRILQNEQRRREWTRRRECGTAEDQDSME